MSPLPPEPPIPTAPDGQTAPPDDAAALATLRRWWGYDAFRPCQLEIIRSVLSGHDTIGLLPTGGGKSITFQVPALMLPGLTVVVTPLISLMKDQVDNLRERGIRAVCLHSGLSRGETRLAEDRCRLGKAKLLYISPERLQSKGFVDMLRRWQVSLLVVDEAHCISQWGYDFRPSYLGIAAMRRICPGIPMLALTASATPRVIADIAEKLEMRAPQQFSLSFTRKNISYIVRHTDLKDDKTVEILSRVPGCAIVYTRSRKGTVALASLLSSVGISAEAYHAGLAPQEKDERQNRWRSGATRVMVATNAFGMGIDKPDVRIVIHRDIPSSLEEYYQEAGRAGRDGLHSLAVLLVAQTDKRVLAKRLADEFPPRETIRRIYEHACNYLNLAIGEGYNRLFEFDIDRFCVLFHYHPVIARSALNILTRSGYMEYGDELSNRARLMMLMDRHQLYGLDLPPEAERVLQAVLRSTTGIFADYERVSETDLAVATGYTQQTVYDALTTLTRMHVLHFIPRRLTPYIYFPTSREEPQHILIPLDVYERRREQMEARLKAMESFAFDDDTCRVSTMLRYFGETPPEEGCGTCDVCRSRRSHAVKDTTRRVVATLLSAGVRRPVAEYVASASSPAARVVEILRELADAGRCRFEGTDVVPLG